MVAVIHYTRSLKYALQYNELKVGQGKASCIGAYNYPKDLESLTIREKHKRLQHRAALNDNVRTNCLHISLNFNPSEKLPGQKLLEIASRFMESAGYGCQPWLIYEHMDAAHPHIHIVTTNIFSNGKGMRTQVSNFNRIQKILRDIEQSFGLVGTQKKQGPDETQINIPALKIQYGKTETLQSIARVLNTVLYSYRYTSLGELNAVLKLYNVMADRGMEGSFLYQVRGLVYRVLDEKGNKIGVPIKASQIQGKPMLSFLEKRFAENESLREQHKNRLKQMITWCILKNTGSGFSELKKLLEKEMIHLELGPESGGGIPRLYFIDYKTKSVFEASQLGEGFTAQAIQERCLLQPNKVSQKGKKLSFNIHP